MLDDRVEFLFDEIMSFLWTRQVEGVQQQKRRLVAKNRIAASIELGGLNIPHPCNVIKGLQMNLEQKIFWKEMIDLENDTNLLQEVLETPLWLLVDPHFWSKAQNLGRFIGKKQQPDFVNTTECSRSASTLWRSCFAYWKVTSKPGQQQQFMDTQKPPSYSLSPLRTTPP